ncbi:translocating chain-associated membrane protein 1-like 1 [Lytechinus pictus]|uniref:translocating chain-associated membrane protein 1-like 1 n=1 Tax=Lytechinus pictus TaxID=7653 RepID=UPI00240D8A62|nr:translocating chain-associated membrane protein 1-like 1 [Lytechinus pictus]
MQVTTPLASMFVIMQYNITSNMTEGESGGEEETRYMYGSRDSFCIAFYFLISIVLHAVVQEYILDKLNRKLHLSKVKHSKFNESGQLVTFYLFSIFWGIDIMMKEGFTQNLAHLWEGYPHILLSFRSKFYFIIQIAYWIHAFPELYFQKVKKEEIGPRIQYSAFYLVFVVSAYLLNLTRLGMICIVIHYIAELTFHVARLLYFSEKTDLSAPCFTLWSILFLLVRLMTISLTTLTVWFGLGKVENQGLDISKGNFNSPLSRLTILTAVCLFQAWLIFNFLMFQLRRRRETQLANAKIQRKMAPKTKKKKDDLRVNDGGDTSDAVSASPIVSDSPHSENGTVRARNKPKKK